MEHDLLLSDTDEADNKAFEPAETIVYDLVEDPMEFTLDDSEQTMDLIPTSELLKDIEVDFEELLQNIDDEEFIINNVAAVEDVLEGSEGQSVEDQTRLTFDLPIANKKGDRSKEKDVEIFKLEDNVNNIEVDDYIELVAVSEAVDVGEETYTLDDHIVLEQTETPYDNEAIQTKVAVEEDLETEAEMVLKKVTVKKGQVKPQPAENTNPFDNPISKTLRERADERRQKMKAFNYKFNASKIEEFEKEPAYKRQGIELSDATEASETQVSRTSVGSDDNEDLQVRSNNSFLHDNVD